MIFPIQPCQSYWTAPFHNFKVSILSDFFEISFHKNNLSSLGFSFGVSEIKNDWFGESWSRLPGPRSILDPRFPNHKFKSDYPQMKQNNHTDEFSRYSFHDIYSKYDRPPRLHIRIFPRVPGFSMGKLFFSQTDFNLAK